MRIVLATPLYPPDIEEPAPYIKGLAERLRDEHAVTIVAFGALPEAIPGVTIIVVSKRASLPFRLFRFARTLYDSVRNADVIYVENGPSVEITAGIIMRIVRVPCIMHLGDERAHVRASHHTLLRLIESFARRGARRVITDRPLARPEILPLEPYPSDAMTAYEDSWRSHLDEVMQELKYATT